MDQYIVKLFSVAGFFLMAVSCMPDMTCPHYEYDGENITNDDYEEPEDQGDDDALPDYGEEIKFWLSAEKNDIGTSVATDYSGNVFVSGVIMPAGVNGDSGQIFVTKFNNDLDVLWTNILSATENETSIATIVDSRGFVYIAGITYGSIDGSFTNEGGSDLFLVRLNGNGTRIWVSQWGTKENDRMSSIAIDSSDNIYVAGGTAGELDGNMNIGGFDIFVTKFDYNGTKEWTKQWGTDENESAIAIATDSKNNVLIAGATDGELDHCEHAEIDPEHPYYADAFLMKMDEEGVKLWTRQWGTENDDYVVSISLNPNDDICVLENRTARMEWNVEDTFVSCFESIGIIKYSEELYLAPIIYGSSVVTDNDESIFVNGYLYGSGYSRIFLAKADKNFRRRTVKIWESYSLQLGLGKNLDIDKHGNVFMTGSVRKDMGPDGYRSDAFLIKVNEGDLDPFF